VILTASRLAALNHGTVQGFVPMANGSLQFLRTTTVN